MKRCRRHLWQKALATITTILDLNPGGINYLLNTRREIHVCVLCGRIKGILNRCAAIAFSCLALTAMAGCAGVAVKPKIDVLLKGVVCNKGECTMPEDTFLFIYNQAAR